MMRLETEKMLAEHLYNIAQHEKNIEGKRLALNEHFRFHPSAAFKRIDRLNNKRISTLDLSTFLKDNGYNYFSVDMTDLIAAYDNQDKDGFLNEQELAQLLVTSTDHILARRTFDRYEEYIGFYDRLPQEIEAMIVGIIIEEVEGLKELNREREFLKSRYDFSRLDAFRAIDNYKLNSILRDDMKYFLNRNGILATALDVDHLFQRLDIDRDGRLTYTEFCDYIEKIGANLQSSQQLQKYNKTIDQVNENNKQHSHRNQKVENNDTQQSNKQQKYSTPQKDQAVQVNKLDYNQNPRFVETDVKFYQPQPPEDDILRNNFISFGIREQHSTPLRKSQSPKVNTNAGFSAAQIQKSKTDKKSKTSRQHHNNQKLQESNNLTNNKNQYSDNNMASLQTTPSPTKGGMGVNNYNSNNSRATQNEMQSSQNGFGYIDGKRLDLDDIVEEEKEQDSQNIVNQRDLDNAQYINIDDNDGIYSDQQQQQYQEETPATDNIINDDPYNEELNSSPFQRLHHLEPAEETNLAECLINMINLETQLEKQKQSLALKQDFNLLDAFRLFDRSVAGQIYKHDLEEGFKKLGVYSVSKKELNLFFKRYDKNCDYKLRYLEFTDAFTPKDKIYADHLSNKRPNYEARHPDEAISLKTKLEFGDAIRNILRYEGNLEDLRINLTSSPYFSISAGFQTLDQDGNGYLVEGDIKSFLESYEFFATQKEIDMLFDKIDRDRDGKITYGEFFTEMAPNLSN